MNLKDTLGIFPGTLSRSFCNELIDIFEKNREYHYQGVTASGYDPGFKDTIDFNLLDNPELDEYSQYITKMSNEKISEYIQRFKTNEEFDTADYRFNRGTYYPVWQLQKYKKNEGHFKAYHTEGEYWEFHNRIFAVMFYRRGRVQSTGPAARSKDRRGTHLFRRCVCATESGPCIDTPVRWSALRSFVAEST